MISRRFLNRRTLKAGAVSLFALVVAWLLLSCSAAWLMTRRAHAPFAEPPPSVTGTICEQVRLDTSDGQQLGAWFVQGKEDGPSVIVLHGHRGCRRDMIGLAGMLNAAGYSVLAVSLRAHGDSTGGYDDVGYSARHDVVAAVAYLEQRRLGRPIFIQGTSMGAAAAIYAAGELGNQVSGYILECPYRDIRSAVRNRTNAYLPWPLNATAYAGLNLVGPFFLPEIDRMAPIDRIEEMPATIPVLLMAGGSDTRARPEEVEAIYQRVASHAKFIVFPDVPHCQFFGTCGAAYDHAVLRFFSRAIPAHD